MQKNNVKKIFIFAAGGHGRVLLHILKNNKHYEVAAFLDDNPTTHGTDLDGIPIIGGKDKLGELKKQGICAGIIGMGDNAARQKVADDVRAAGFFLVNAIDPSAVVHASAQLGDDITIWAGSIINVKAQIKNNVIINCGAVIEHECLIEDSAHIGPGATLAGRVRVQERSFVAMNASVIQGVTIGKDSIVGAGAVVLEDVPDRTLVAGVPAKRIKKL